jgi:diguanylate cyclase (GGDEF)-like protein
MRTKRWIVQAAVLAAYLLGCRLGLSLASVNANAAAFWPGSGLAIGALLIFGYRVWPAIFAGSLIVNLLSAGSPFVALGISVGNTLEALVGAWLIDRFASGRHALDRTVNILKSTGLIAVSAGVSAVVGVLALSAAGSIDPGAGGRDWVTWWLGNVSGALIVMPALLHWSNYPRLHWDQAHIAEALALLLSAITVSLVVFGGSFVSGINHFPLEFLCTPIFIWAAFRFSPRVAATMLLPVGVIAVWGTVHGTGPFVRGSLNESLLLVQAFMSVTAVMTLVLAAEIFERRRAELQFRQLAVSDPMTGLPNYRQLSTVLDAEIRRSQRTVRPFAVLFLDLDGLKQINDRHGHLTGSRALIRLADVLRLSCRSMDTAARFGGDEFALVLPETGEAAARQVGVRVCQRLATDGENPVLSVSIGVAIYPRDGDSSEALLGTADKALYVAKARGGGGVVVDFADT